MHSAGIHVISKIVMCTTLVGFLVTEMKGALEQLHQFIFHKNLPTSKDNYGN